MSFSAMRWIRCGACAMTIACAAVGVMGCQSQIGGQVLPSPFTNDDDVQYYPPGPEFKLSREAAAQKAYEAELRLKQSESKTAGMSQSHSCPLCSAH